MNFNSAPMSLLRYLQKPFGLDALNRSINMCGIAGIIDFRGNAVERSELEGLADALKHRGPDGSGIHVDGSVGLVNRRLAIIDPAGGQQPVYNDNGTVAIVYNGEVYNFIELRQELKAHFSFRTGCDTEVILRAYERWGADCVTRLRGMFAFAIHDRRRGIVLLARDRVGIKPLYFAHQNGRLAFASELGALITLGWIERRIDRAALAQYLRLVYVPDPATIYSRVSKLEPGHVLEIDLHTAECRKQRYWMLKPQRVERSEQDWIEALSAELDQSVRLHTRSDVSFGAFLSGGVDSSIVAAAMRSSVSGAVHTFSIGFDEEKYSELRYAKQASELLGTAHTERVVSASSVDESLLRKIARHFGEPFADSSSVPTWHVANLAASSVKMVLSGDGGDEAFAGYPSYVDMLHEEQAVEPAARALGLARTIRQFFRAPPRAQTLQERHDIHRTLFTDRLIQKLLPGIDLPEPPRAPITLSAGGDPILGFQAEDLHVYLPGDILTKVDRMSMANSLEVRVPLLDHVLLEFAFSVPLSLRIRAQQGTVLTKYILRRSGERFLPASFFDRPKQGFGMPVAEWCAGPLRGLIEAKLGSRSNPVFDLIDFDAARPIWQNDVSGRGAGSLSWALLMLALWVDEVHLAR
jgi:asparagine synthase (glutamine-hydrolysing)